MGLMSTSTEGAARRLVRWPLHGRQNLHSTPLTSRLLRALWLRERGAVELRWASITVATMVLLGLFGRALDPFDGEFDSIVLIATLSRSVCRCWPGRGSPIVSGRCRSFASGSGRSSSLSP